MRIGRFTSSEIVALTSNGKKTGEFGKPFYTYVKQTNQERKAKRSLDLNRGKRDTVWGSFVESYLMHEAPELIGFEYTFTPSLTVAHPKYPDMWCGSRDMFNNKRKAVVDLKCPFTLTSFCNFADCETIGDVRNYTDKGEDYYWQLVSNACIAGVDKAELIVFIPTPEILQNIQLYAVHGDHHFNNVYFIGNAIDEELPYLPSDAEYKNILRFEFDIPETDLLFLENRVIEASKLLYNNTPSFLASPIPEGIMIEKI